MADMKTPETAVTKRPARTPLYTAARVLAAVLFRTLCPVKYYHAERAGLPLRFAASKVIEGDELIAAQLELDENERETLEHICLQLLRKKSR